MDLGRVVEAHNAIKDARTAKRHAWEKEDAELEVQQNRLRAFLLDFLNKNDIKSVNTDHGTFYRTEKIKPSAADWGAIWEWMKANDAPDLMERRLKAAFIKEYMEAHGGTMPPGVNVYREYEISIRRPNTARTSSEEDDT